MSDRSAIEWTTATWNPIRARNLKTGAIGWYCEHVSLGCQLCYAERDNNRFGTKLPFKPGHRDDVELFLDEKMLMAPLNWRKPRKIFVCSMTDLFGDFVKDEWLDRILKVMGNCDDLDRGHVFQVLTKRPERMRDYMRSPRAYQAWNWPRLETEAWPPRNVWFGVSAERQEEADDRIPALLQTSAAVRFVSCEPLIGPIELRHWFYPMGIGPAGTARASYDPLLDWVIVGGESGPKRKAHFFDLRWARSIVEQCRAADVRCFVKQLGTNPRDSERIGSDAIITLASKKGGDPTEWPADLRVREFAGAPA